MRALRGRPGTGPKKRGWAARPVALALQAVVAWCGGPRHAPRLGVPAQAWLQGRDVPTPRRVATTHLPQGCRPRSPCFGRKHSSSSTGCADSFEASVKQRRGHTMSGFTRRAAKSGCSRMSKQGLWPVLHTKHTHSLQTSLMKEHTLSHQYNTCMIQRIFLDKELWNALRKQGSRALSSLEAVTNHWIAVKEFSLSYHILDIWSTIWFLDNGSLN